MQLYKNDILMQHICFGWMKGVLYKESNCRLEFETLREVGFRQEKALFWQPKTVACACLTDMFTINVFETYHLCCEHVANIFIEDINGELHYPQKHILVTAVGFVSTRI